MKIKKAFMMSALIMGLFILITISVNCGGTTPRSYHSIWEDVYGRTPPYIDQIENMEIKK